VPFYGFELVERLDIIGMGSLEAWRARDGDRAITLVRSRPDIIEKHLRGELYYSNIAELDEDLQSIAASAPGLHELRLREVRRVEGGQIPLAVFDRYAGWPLREIVRRVTCAPPVAAAIALEVFRAYSSNTAATSVTEQGELVRQLLPAFPMIWSTEAPSFIRGPEVSVGAGIREGRAILATMSGLVTRDDLDDNTEAAAAAFVDELEKIADREAAWPTVARLLATRPAAL
jgi:hypothetical protein